MTVQPDIDLMDTDVLAHGREDDLYAHLRSADPVHFQEENDNGPSFWSLFRYDDVREAAADAERLSSAQGTQIFDRKVEGHGRASIHNMDDPEHAELRKVVLPHLRAVKIKQWDEVIASSVARVLGDAAAQDGEFDLVQTISAQLPMLVVSQVLGVPPEDAHKMVGWTNKLASGDPDHRVDAQQLEATRTEVLDYFRWLSEERRREPQNDIVSVLVHGTKFGEPLDWEELAAYYIVLVAAGNETTRHLITGGTLALDENPGTWQRIIDDEALLPGFVEESFRYVSPLMAMRRTATEDMEIRGRQIAKGDRVVMWFGAANRDPEVFAQPEVFDITRDPNPHMTFGWGVHFCLGTHLARIELREFFAQQRARRLEFAVAGDPVRVRNNLFRGWSSLPVTAVQR